VILVDTNVWSELTRRAPDPRVIGWLMRNEPHLYLSVIVIAEIRRGYELPQAAAQRDVLASWLAGLEEQYASRIITFEARDAHMLGQLAASRTLGGTLLDAQLSAQALTRNATIATRNLRDFAWTGVKLIDPFGN
jgi:toxin FitB